MRTHVISCEIFKDIVEKVISDNVLNYSTEYLEIKGHNIPNELKEVLQKRIYLVKDVDKIILLYGICGNAINGIEAIDIPIVIPRVHDCCALFLGSNKNFLKHFSNRLSQGWACYRYEKDSYEEEYKDYLKKYDEDTAKYLIETMYPKSDDLIYIHLHHPNDDENINKYEKVYKVEVLKGSHEYIKRILLGKASEKEVHFVKPKEKIRCIYDYEEVLTSL